MRFSESIKGISGEIQKSLGSLTESMGNIMGGFSVIRQFRLQGPMKDRFEEHNRDIMGRSIKRSARQAWLESYGSLTGWINFGGVLALGAFLAGKGLIGFGTMVALVNYLWNVNRMIRETGRSVAQFHGYMAGAERVLELEREAEEPAVDPDGRYARAAEGGPVVEMRDIEFSYDGKRKALDGFNLEALDGQTVALVGPSGGGKTTVLKILLGFHRPSGGRVSVRIRDGAEIGFAALRGETAYVPQDPFLFDGTVAENIGFGRPGATREEIERAARSAHADEFVLKLEKGYDTVVGERGVKLSGGQKQRIAIARAFLKDVPVLLLDEATSSLDSHSERRIQEALRELGGRKTVIVIAHRLSTVEDADVIYVVEGGKAVERGRHEELLAKGGLYKRLHEMQFALAGAEAAAED
jgi:ABC-type multidrug transport system fused ATPase/permease subunit